MNTSLDDLVEINDKTKLKQFIKRFILEDEVLYRLIFFAYANPLDESCEIPENPYIIFDSNDTDNSHGLVLFDRKNDTILNYEVINLLIDTESVRKSNFVNYNETSIIIRVISKGNNIRNLENGVNRISAILKRLDDNLNEANISNLGVVRQKSISDLSLNEENEGKLAIYSMTTFNSDCSTNKNFQKRIRGDFT